MTDADRRAEAAAVVRRAYPDSDDPDPALVGAVADALAAARAGAADLGARLDALEARQRETLALLERVLIAVTSRREV